MMSDGMIAVTEARGTELIVNLPTLVLTYKIRIMMNMMNMIMIVIMMMDMMIVIMMIKKIMIIVVVIVHYPLTSPLIEELI